MDAETLRLRDLIEARTQALARRGRDVARAERTRAFLVCRCGTERYGLPLGAVAQVHPARACTSVPGAPPALLGIVALAGRIVSVLDLGRSLGRPASADPQAGHLVLVRGGTVPIALAVDRVVAVRDVAAPDAEAGADGAGLGQGAVSGYAPGRTLSGEAVSDGAGFVIVDLPRLLRRYCP